MKRRIFSLVVTLVVAISVVLGVSLTANAADGDGLKDNAVSLAENVTLKMEVAIAAPTEGAYAKITLPGNKVDATQLVAAAPKSGDNYVFFAEVAVKDLAKSVTIEICNADGTTLVASATTSALAYCDKYLALDGENEFDGLVSALKAYASAADYYFDPAKTADTAITPDFTGVADAAFAGELPAGVTHRSATLLLESETTIRHYFELASGKYVENYTFFVDLDKDGKCDVNEVITPKTKTAADGKTVYYVDIAGLTPNMLDEVYTVGVTGKADGKTYTCDYGVLTYLKRAANDDNDAKNLATAILAYSAEAGQLKGTITFNANGGSTVTNQTYEYGVAFPVVAPTAKDGEVFLGWTDANGNVVTTVPASQTGDVALTAKWYKAEKFSAANFKTGFTANGAAAINQGVALHTYFFENGERYTNEVTLSFDILWADYTVQHSPSGRTMFRFIDQDGGTAPFLAINDSGVINETGDTLSKTEATNIKLVMDASAFVYGDDVADKVSISYYVGGVYKTTKIVTLSKDISKHSGVDSTGADKAYRAVFAGFWSNVTSDAKITNLTVTDTGAGCVAVSPEGTVATYTHGTATKLPTPEKDGYKFAGWFADEALTQPIDEIPANAAGVFNVYPKWIQVGQYTEYNFAEDQMLIASLVYCDHVDAGADGKCDTCTRCVAHTDANSDKVCDVCGLKTSRCGNKAENHTDADSDTICDVCGLSNKNAAGYQSSDKAIPGVTYDPSSEWSTGYAKGVAGDNGGYLVVARVNGDGPAVSSNSTNKISELLADCDKKVMTYEIVAKKNGSDAVLGLDLRVRNSGGGQKFAGIRATSNGVTLGDKFVKLGYVIDFDAKAVRLYADGVYAGSSAFNFAYTEFNVSAYGFLQMRLSGTGSICIDSIGIYAGDLYR